MARITDYEKINFPVKLESLFAEAEINGEIIKINIPNNKIVVREDTGKPLGVVSNNYKLITNDEAVKMGKQCCMDLFGVDEADNIEVFNVDAPSTASYCHIDLVHNSYVMNLWDEPDSSETYVPYVRVTNSYNTSRALRFDIGFCRKICQNGMIFESETIRFTYSHLKHKFNDKISFQLEGNKIQNLFEQFKAKAEQLQKTAISFDDGLNILFALLNIKHEGAIDFTLKAESRMAYDELKDEIENRLYGYINTLGENSYALFNTLTDIASHPVESRYLRRDKNSMQRIAGNWVNSFSRESQEAVFTLPAYIESLKFNSPENNNGRFQENELTTSR